MDIKERLSQDLKDYQSIPFWSWNDKLEHEELIRQIHHMKEIGIGGFFMHARGGLKNEYLSEDWFKSIKICIDEAKKQNMNAWCYDENGWPSGFAGMKLLEDSNNWVHYITHEIKDSFDNSALAVYYLENKKLIRLKKQNNDVKEYICIYDKINSSVVDILNKDVVEKFIAETHEKYYQQFKNDFGIGLMGFFTDEPQYFRWDTAYTPIIIDEYEKEYGEACLDTLGALFIDCEQAYQFRFKYWRLMNKLFVSSFVKQIYNWCEDHNCKLMGHAIEEQTLFCQMWCCAGVMPFYEYEHIPCIDWLGREIGTELAPKQASSVAQQLGKKQVLTETFSCTGWDVTPKELKRIAEWQYVNGVNLMCQHLYPYSIRGQRKRDYPAFFSDHNPWIKESKQFNDYFTALGYMLAESKEVVKVAIIHPMHSAYLTYNRKTDYASVKDVEDNFKELIEKFGAANIGHHYIDEILLEKHGKVNGNRFIMGLCEYEYVVIPKMSNIDSSTIKLLKKYAENGGKIWIADERPICIDGKKASLDFLVSNVTFDNMINPDITISDISTEIRSTYRKSDFGNFMFVVNLSKDKEYAVDFKVKAKGAELFDLELREKKAMYYKKTVEGIIIPLSIKPGQSYVIMLDDNANSTRNIENDNEIIRLDTNATIINVTENALTIDYAQLSYDNVNFEKKLPIPAISDRLLRERRNRNIFLKYSFSVKEIPDTIFIETERIDALNIWLNNESIKIESQGKLDRSFVRTDVKSRLKIGINEIVFELNYYQNEHVYYVLFDAKEATESLKNCLSYDTDVEAIYILGDFEVSSENSYEEGIKNTSISKGNFTIQKSNKNINLAKINQDGYPFFAGEFTVVKKFFINNTNYKLKLSGRFSLAKIFINNNFVANLMFDNICDLSNYLKIGENTLKIKLINSNRNLLGPFHVKKDPEPFLVWPNLFEFYGTWENGESLAYTHNYAFVNFGVWNIDLYN